MLLIDGLDYVSASCLGSLELPHCSRRCEDNRATTWSLKQGFEMSECYCMDVKSLEYVCMSSGRHHSQSVSDSVSRCVCVFRHLGYPGMAESETPTLDRLW